MSYYPNDEQAFTGPDRRPTNPPVDARRLWAGGIATAVVAALLALVSELVVLALPGATYLYQAEELGRLGPLRSSQRASCLPSRLQRSGRRHGSRRAR